MNNQMDPNYLNPNPFGFPGMPQRPNCNCSQELKRLENRIFNLEREMNRIRSRVNRLENNFGGTSFSSSEPENNYTSNYNPNSYNLM